METISQDNIIANNTYSLSSTGIVFMDMNENQNPTITLQTGRSGHEALREAMNANFKNHMTPQDVDPAIPNGYNVTNDGVYYRQHGSRWLITTNPTEGGDLYTFDANTNSLIDALDKYDRSTNREKDLY